MTAPLAAHELSAEGFRARRRRRWTIVAVVVGLVALLLVLRRVVGLEFGPESIRAWVERLGPWGPIAFVGVVAFRVPLGLPSSIVLMGGGLVFGALAGTVYGAAGLMVSALVVFGGARWGGRDTVARRLPARFLPLLDVAGSRLGALFVALGTAYPMSPITLYHLIAGITRMSLFAFVIAAGLGALGRSAIYTLFGSSLMQADAGRILAASALLLAAALVPLAFPAPRNWLLRTFSQRESVLPRD